LEVRDSSGDVVEVGGARLRALLIMLALRPGQLVTSSQLIEGLWGEQPPSEPGNALQALVSRLRRAVPGAEIASRPAGYQLMIDPEATDVARFERLASRGRTSCGTILPRQHRLSVRRSRCGAGRRSPISPRPPPASQTLPSR
jgi:two-component SAPR family response regulator